VSQEHQADWRTGAILTGDNIAVKGQTDQAWWCLAAPGGAR